LAVFLRGQLVVCIQVPLQHREVFAALKANDVIVADRSLDIYGVAGWLNPRLSGARRLMV
jgi:hypothetical protein